MKTSFEELYEYVLQNYSWDDILYVFSIAYKKRQASTTIQILCPFHKERTPSLSLWAESKNWYCHGCGASGNIFGFVYYRLFGEELFLGGKIEKLSHFFDSVRKGREEEIIRLFMRCKRHPFAIWAPSRCLFFWYTVIT